MKKAGKTLIINVIGVFLVSLGLTGCSQQAAKTSSPKITVSYTLQENRHAFAHKQVKVAKKARVMTGLKKAWPVKTEKGFVTAIDGRKQEPAKKIYWTYTINHKFAQKGASQQPVHQGDKIKFTLAKVNN